MRISIEVSAADLNVLEHIVEDADKWMQDMFIGKVANCRAKMVKEGTEAMLADPLVFSIPATPDAVVSAMVEDPSYKTRAVRVQDAKDAQEAERIEVLKERVALETAKAS